MTDAVARVETIFRKSRGDCLGHGSSGIVLTVNSDIVVKTACRYDTHPPGYAEEERYSLTRIKQESAVFDILEKPENWHPNIVLSFLHAPDYIFMERVTGDLVDYVTGNFPVPLCTTYRFLRDIVNAVSWLGQMAILHGDVRPPNVLIDGKGHVKLCDFDNACSFGQYIQVGNAPYYEQSDTGSFGIAGPESEQGAIGCCAYFMSTGTEPQDRSHSTSQIPVFGAIIRKCWDGRYPSIAELGKDMIAGIDQQECQVCQAICEQGSLMTIEHYQKRVAECRKYLSLNGLVAEETSSDSPSKTRALPSPLHFNPSNDNSKLEIYSLVEYEDSETLAS